MRFSKLHDPESSLMQLTLNKKNLGFTWLLEWWVGSNSSEVSFLNPPNHSHIWGQFFLLWPTWRWWCLTHVVFPSLMDISFAVVLLSMITMMDLRIWNNAIQMEWMPDGSLHNITNSQEHYSQIDVISYLAASLFWDLRRAGAESNTEQTRHQWQEMWH